MSNETPHLSQVIALTGAKGGGKGGSSAAAAPYEAPNDLRSVATVRVLELLGEGEIKGFVNGLKSVYFDATPLQNEDGTFNFKGVKVTWRWGLPDQDYIPNFPQTETTQQVGTKVEQAIPLVKTLTDPYFDKARVTARVPALTYSDTKNNKLLGCDVTFRIEARYYNGPWVNPIGIDLMIKGKTISPYDRSYTFDLPKAPNGAPSFPWDVRFTRVQADSPDSSIQNDIYFATLTGVIEAKLSYPNSAIVGVEVDAEQFGQDVPVRSYEVYGRIISVPSNYDPATRAYTGIWDGTFKKEWSDNPAWVLYDLLTNERFGLGEYIDTVAVDKWALYQIAAYCDGLVPDGYGGQEPRMTFNGSIRDQRDAFEVIASMAGAFRGMAYWSSGTVTATQDRPATPDILVTPANVINGMFHYQSSALKARHTVALVNWNDPQQQYRRATEVVEDAEGMRRYGYRPTTVDAFGCTSRGQANRYGKWVLFTELNETQAVTYKAGLDHAFIRPGNIVAVQDPTIAGVGWSGRLNSASTANRLTLDRPLTLPSDKTYAIMVVLPSGKVQEVNISGPFDVETKTVQLVAPLDEAPAAEAVWVVTTSDLSPQFFKVVSIREVEAHIYEVSGVYHEPSKFAVVDQNANFDPLPVSRDTNVILPPSGLKAVETLYRENGTPKTSITLSWVPPAQAFSTSGYYVAARHPSGDLVSYPKVRGTTIVFNDTQAGEYVFYVSSVGLSGKASQPVELTFAAGGYEGATGPGITGLAVKGGGTVFTGRSCSLEWGFTFPEGAAPYAPRSAVRIFDADTDALLHQEIVSAPSWTYDYDTNVNDGGPRRRFKVRVAALDPLEREGTAATITVRNPPPEMIIPSVIWTTVSLAVSYDPPADPDFAGGIIWASKQQGFNPLITTPLYIGPNLANFLPLDFDATYYVRFAAFDAFGQNPAELNISPEQMVRTTNNLIDANGPDQPLGLRLTTVLITSATGVSTASITATWSPVTSENLARYEFELAEGDGTNAMTSWERILVGKDQTTATWNNLKPGALYAARVRGTNGMGFWGAYSQIVTIQAALNLSKPGPITGFRVDASFETSFLSWVNPSDADLASAEIWEGTSTAPVTKRADVSAPSAFWSDPTLKVAVTRTYWIRPVNSSGTVGDWAGPVSAQSPQLQAAALANQIIDATKIAASLAVPQNVTSLPATAGTGLAFFNGELYRWVNGDWTKAIQTGDLSGKVTAAQIESLNAAQIAGQLTNAQLAAIDAAKLVGQVVSAQIATLDAAKISGQLTDSQILGMAATKIAGQLSSSQIASLDTLKLVGQIRDTQLADNAVTQAKLASDLSAVGIVASLPSPAGWTGPKLLLVDGKVWRLVNGQWTAGVGASDIAGTITAGQIASLEAAKISGTLSDGQIAGISAAKLVGQVVSGQIASLEASKLAGTITSDQIASLATTKLAGQLSSGQIADLAANKITGSLVAAQIASVNASALAGQITSDQVASIAAAQLTGQITGTQITDNAVTTAKIAAGAVVAGSIAAGAVTTNKLTLMNREINIVGLNIRYVVATSSIEWDAGTIFYRQDDGSMTSQAVSSAIVAVSGSAWYSIVWIKGRNTLDWFTDINYAATTGGADCITIATFDNGTGLDVRHGATIIDGDRIVTNSIIATKIIANSITTNQIQAGGVNADRLVANSITAGQLATNSVTAGKIDAGAITAREIVAGSIVGDRIAANTITGANILAGSIGADRIVAKSLTAGQIATGTITATEIAGQTITGDKVAAGTITGANVSAGTLTARELASNSITTSKLTIANREINITGLDIRYRSEDRRIMWDAGTIFWRGDDGAMKQSNITADSFVVAGNTWYSVVWAKGNTFLGVSTDVNYAAGSTEILTIATYGNGATLAVNFGATYIDGGQIITNSVTASQIKVGSLTGDRIMAGTLTASLIQGGTITGDKIAGRTITAGSLIAGSITAAEIASRTITADRIVAGAITATEIGAKAVTAGKIDAGAVTASEIAAGSITTSKLSITTGNIAQNADMSSGTQCFVRQTSSWGQPVMTAVETGWVPTGMRGLAFTASGGGGTTGFFDVIHQLTNANGAVRNFPCNAGQRYEFSCYATSHRCRFEMYVNWCDSNGTTIGSAGTVLPPFAKAGGALRDYPRAAFLADAPAGAASFFVILRGGQVSADFPYVYACAMMYAAVPAGTMECSPYIPPSITTLDGSSITTGTLYADRIVARSIYAGLLQANTITANEIAGATITGDKVAANTITGANINAGTITAREIAANSITTEKLTIANRDINVTGVNLRMRASDRCIMWDAGTIYYRGDDNNMKAASIAAGSFIAAQSWYAILWYKGRGSLDWYQDVNAGSYDTNWVVMGTFDNSSNSALTTYHGGTVIDGNNIWTGTLNANRIIAGTITADQLAVNSVVAGKIAAGAIGVEQLAAGAITADKIGVGLNGSNQLWNSDFMAGSGQSVPNIVGSVNQSGSGPYCGINASGFDWQPPGMRSLQISSTGATTAGSVFDAYVGVPQVDGSYSNKIPVVANKRYEVSGYISSHNSIGVMLVAWYDANNALISNFISTNKVNNYRSGGALGVWARCTGFVVAPANAAYASITLRMEYTGGSNCYNFWTGLYFSQAKDNQIQFSDWAPGSYTVISGGAIATNTLHADRIIAGTITADKIAGYTITGDKISGNSITGAHIQAGTITTDKITIGNGQALSSWQSGADVTKINGGAIAANSITANKISIGMRGLNFVGINLRYVVATRRIEWDSGSIFYQDDNGNGTGVNIPAGGFVVSGASWYSIVWFKGNSNFDVSTDINYAFGAGPNCVTIATYSNSTGIAVNYGETIIDGARIVTGSITATQIAAGTIQADQIGAGAITASKIGAGQVSADKISGGTLQAGTIFLNDNRLKLESYNGTPRIVATDGTNLRVLLGNTSGFSPGGGDWGLIVWDNNNQVLLAPSGVNGGGIWARSIQAGSIAANSITANELTTGRLITGSAQIGDAVVDTLQIAGSAISQVVSGSVGSGNRLDLYVAVRSNKPISLRYSWAGSNGQQTDGTPPLVYTYRNDSQLTVAYPLMADRRWSPYYGEIVDAPGPGTHKYSVIASGGNITGIISEFLR